MHFRQVFLDTLKSWANCAPLGITKHLIIETRTKAAFVGAGRSAIDVIEQTSNKFVIERIPPYCTFRH